MTALCDRFCDSPGPGTRKSLIPRRYLRTYALMDDEPVYGMLAIAGTRYPGSVVGLPDSSQACNPPARETAPV